MDQQDDDNAYGSSDFGDASSTDPKQSNPLNDVLNKKVSVPSDVNIDPDPTLNSYQDDIATGVQEDTVQYEQGTNPAEFIAMPEGELKEEFDKMAVGDTQANPIDETIESTRESIEDQDENDKDRSTDDSWLK